MPDGMTELIDQMNQTIRLARKPERIVSLVPSQTELLHYFGLENEVIGITKFCIHPASWFQNKRRIGGTKNLHLDVIDALSPDLIIGNKEENSAGDIQALKEKYPVYMSDIYTVEDAFEMIEDLARLTNKEEEARRLLVTLRNDFDTLPQFTGRVLYFIWNEPYMVVGPNTFIGNLLERLGFENCITDPMARYVELSDQVITSLSPDCIILSSEPYPFNEKHKQQLGHLCKSKIILTDGEMFSWYGSRMLKMKDYFTQLAHLDWRHTE